MITQLNSSASFRDTKPHYLLLDALRGVVALMVVWYHFFEGFAFASGTAITTFAHGHLGVDFFFMLSGFVISYAYDDRWQVRGRMDAGDGANVRNRTAGNGTKGSSQTTAGNGTKGSSRTAVTQTMSQRSLLTLGDFFKRRMIRLHPMLVLGTLIGAVTFLMQGGIQWDGTVVAFRWVVVAMLLGALLIPAYPGAGYDVRGNGEMYSLNGPSWSLFFEYIGNLLYALFIRRFSNRLLLIWVVVTGLLWGVFVLTDVSGYDMLGVGWTLDGLNFVGGFLRMIFPFSLGMYLSRMYQSCTFKPVRVKYTLVLATLVLFALFSLPYWGKMAGWEIFSLNSLYEWACVVLVFPGILWLAASDASQSQTLQPQTLQPQTLQPQTPQPQTPQPQTLQSQTLQPQTPQSLRTSRIYKFLGDISYPLYIVHYPVMYLFYAWLIKHQLYSLSAAWPAVILVYVFVIALAYACLKWYDEPVRHWLMRSLVSPPPKSNT